MRERERVWRDHDAVRGRGWRRSGAASAEHVGTERDGPREGAGGECNGEGYGGRARSFHSPLAPRGFPWLGLPLQFSGWTITASCGSIGTDPVNFQLAAA